MAVVKNLLVRAGADFSELQKEMVKARSIPVQCIETGIIYASASEAARQVPKTTQSKICMVCRGQRNTCGGFHWKYYKKENNNE